MRRRRTCKTQFHTICNHYSSQIKVTTTFSPRYSQCRCLIDLKLFESSQHLAIFQQHHLDRQSCLLLISSSSTPSLICRISVILSDIVKNSQANFWKMLWTYTLHTQDDSNGQNASSWLGSYSSRLRKLHGGVQNFQQKRKTLIWKRQSLNAFAKFWMVFPRMIWFTCLIQLK